MCTTKIARLALCSAWLVANGCRESERVTAAVPPSPARRVAATGRIEGLTEADVASKRVVATSADNLGTGTGGIQVSPFNGRVYISAYSGQVSVLDPVTLKVVKQFATPMTPDGLFFGTVR